MIYSPAGKQCRIVGPGSSNDSDLLVIAMIPEEGEEIDGLSEFLCFRRELTADGGVKELRAAVKACGRAA